MTSKHPNIEQADDGSIPDINEMMASINQLIMQKTLGISLGRNKKESSAKKGGTKASKRKGSSGLEGKDGMSRFEVAEESPGFLLWKTSRMWKRGIEIALSEFKLTHTQFVLLAGVWYLTQEGSGVLQKTLSDFTSCDISMSSQIIRVLKKRHLISRERRKEDARALFLTLTTEGSKLLKSAMKVVEDYDEEFFKRLGGDCSTLTHSLAALCRGEE